MSTPAQLEGNQLYVVTSDHMSRGRILAGRALMWWAAFILLVMVVIQGLHEDESITFGFETWRPVLYAYAFWAVCLCIGQVLTLSLIHI